MTEITGAGPSGPHAGQGGPRTDRRDPLNGRRLATTMAVLRRGRASLVPPGGWRDRALWVLLCVWRAYRTEGMRRASQLCSALVRATLRRMLRHARRRLARRGPPSGRGLATAEPVQLGLASSFLARAAQSQSQRPDIVVLPVIDWSFRYQRPQQLAARLAEAGHRVVYLRTTFHEGDAAILTPVIAGVVEAQLPGPPECSIYASTLTPAMCHGFVEALGQLRARLGLMDVACVVNLPFWAPLARELRDRFGWLVIYDCLDDYAGFDNTRGAMLASEEQLAQMSDLVLVTSRHLLAKQQALNPNTVLVPNGADFDHFGRRPAARAPEVAGLAAPIIGYYGAISSWFDTTLVGQLARARPGWTIVLIGSGAGADLRPLGRLPNVHLLGEKPYAQLPAYLDAFDVCTIPFRSTPLTNATNPVKLFEYLSAGKPVVATDLAELRQYAAYVALASGTQQWLAAIERALAPAARSAAEVERRRAFGREQSWTKRVETVRAELDRLYARVRV